MLKTILQAIAKEGVNVTLNTSVGTAQLNIELDDNGDLTARLKARPARRQPATLEPA
ncbi:hypothetical protein PBI_KRATIO_71 [Mycobacterium phage Kratio]|uniref:Uncharacterized protein n=1 Tax=Mycobacterium phage Kratio TaxID=1606763 RepID=A0A0C5AMT9_9CAUD|nr:hypothetical protein PBI_KRATIO_71 [Mycobacterium phage Kratio]AJK27400.1 hypothetical protein PBI_KRATIO_71 [Mycobacterium phage Kratio]